MTRSQNITIPTWLWVSACALTGIILIFLIAAYFFTPQMTSDQRNIVRFMFALLAGAAFFFVGETAQFRLGFSPTKFLRVTFSATGAIAVFALAYVYPPYWYADLRQKPITVISLKTIDSGPGISLIDVIVRNSGEVTSVIHKAELFVLNREIERMRGFPYLLPVTYQYNVAISHKDETVSLDMAQAVSPRDADRFQIAVGLAEEYKAATGETIVEFPDHPPHDVPGIPNRYMSVPPVLRMRSKMRLRLYYDEANYVESLPFDFVVNGISGVKAAITGLTLQDRLRLLTNPDIDIVESTIGVLSKIGEPPVLRALLDLRGRDLSHLRAYYEANIHEKRRTGIETPERRLAQFNAELDKAIQRVRDQMKTN